MKRAIKKIHLGSYKTTLVLGVVLFAVFFVVAPSVLKVGSVHAASVGPTDAYVAQNSATTGTLAWTTPENATSSNNGYATRVLAGVTTTNHIAAGFSFSINASATITGIEVLIEKSRTGGTAGNARDAEVKLVKAGVVVGANPADTATNWPTTDGTVTYGSSTYLWGTTWTPAEINAVDFGVVFSAKGAGATTDRTARVDRMAVTIYYTPYGVPTVTGINPTTGANTGSVSITSVTGTNFDATSTATVKLKRSGETTITCTGFALSSSTQLSNGSCPITDAVGGLWDVEVTNAVGSSTLASAFTITAPNDINLLQSSSTSANGSAATIARAFTSNNTAGNLILAVVGWGDANETTSTVTDTLGNTYSRVVYRFDATNNQGIALFYAQNIAAGANTVTATFSTGRAFRRLLIHEYSGAATTSVFDVAASSSGTATAGQTDGVTSGNITTTANRDLIFGLVADTDGGTGNTVGSGFTQRQTALAGEYISEDRIQATTGTIAATFTFGAADRYVIGVAAFKKAPTAAGGGGPTVTAINPNSGTNDGSASITSVIGTNFDATSTATVKLKKSGQSDISCSGFALSSSTQLSNGSCPITGAATGTWDVQVANNTTTGTLTSGFTISSVWPPDATSVSYTQGGDGALAGDSATITGVNFGTVSAGSRANCAGGTGTGCIRFVVGGNATVVDGNVTAWSNTSITFTVSSTLTSNGGAASLQITASSTNDASPLNFYIYPNVTAVASVGANAGREYSAGDNDGLIMLSGDHFGGAGTATILGSAATENAGTGGSCTTGGYSSTTICYRVPAAISDSSYTGNVVLTRTADSKTSTWAGFRVLPRVASNSPATGSVATVIQITGDHLCQTGTCPVSPNRSAAADNVKFGSTQAADGDFVTPTNGATTVTSASLTTGGANRLLLAVVSIRNTSSQTVSSVADSSGLGLTWVLVTSSTNSTNVRTEIWRTLAASAFTGTVTATLSASAKATIVVSAYSGVNTTGTWGSGAIGVYGSATGNSTAPSVAITTGADNSLVVSGLGAQGTPTVTAGATQTVISTQNTTGGADSTRVTGTGGRRNSVTTPAGSVTSNYTLGTSGQWAIMAVEIKKP